MRLPLMAYEKCFDYSASLEQRWFVIASGLSCGNRLIVDTAWLEWYASSEHVSGLADWIEDNISTFRTQSRHMWKKISV